MIIITLKLGTLTELPSANAAALHDNWLDNNDSTLFTEINTKPNSPELNKLVEKISLDSSRRVFHINTLEIQQHQDGFILQHEGKPILLTDGDVIALNDQYLQVQIIRQTIVNNPLSSTHIEPNPQRIEDIWQDFPTKPALSGNASLNVSSNIVPQSANNSYDPLSFLYGSQQATQDSYANFLAPTVPSCGNSSVDSFMNIMPIEGRANYAPSPMPTEPKPHSDFCHHPTDNAGNVLRDLGINESPLTLGHSASKQAPLSLQAPLDMIDELLYDESNDMQPNLSREQYHSAYSHNTIKQAPGPGSPWHNFKKKLFG